MTATTLPLACLILATMGRVVAQQNLGTGLAENGHCPEAMPYLRKAMARPLQKEVRKTVAIDLARCAMDVRANDDAIAAMRQLTREFPADPEVLYLAVHVYSGLSIQASQELLHKAPGSSQVHELNAEALETQGRWDDAAEEYKVILQNDSDRPGIHFKLGRLYLSRPKTPTTMDDARREFEAELKINPSNGGAEYVLGEIARQAGQWPDAIAHFTRASKLDPRFVDAYAGLGRSLMAADRPADAIPPLESAVKLQPANPEMHFHLATAYRRAGRKADADREMLAQRQAAEKARQVKDELNKAITGAQVERAPH
jgi:tetratricopeptide (TPR) repeat protein